MAWGLFFFFFFGIENYDWKSSKDQLGQRRQIIWFQNFRTGVLAPLKSLVILALTCADMNSYI